MNRQIILTTCIAALIVAGIRSDAISDEERTWTDRTGKYSIEATFVRIKEDQVTLRKNNGELVTLSIEKLSPKDQAYIRDRNDPAPKPEVADNKAAQGVARKFFEALRKRSSSSTFESILSEKAQALYENDNSPIKDLPSPDRGSSSIRLGKVAIDGDEATVKVKVKLRGKHQDTTLHLRQEADRWVVYAISAVGPNDDVQTIHFEDNSESTGTGPSRPAGDAGDRFSIPDVLESAAQSWRQMKRGDKEKYIAELRTYLNAGEIQGQHIGLIQTIASLIEGSGDPESAAEVYLMAQSILSKSKNRQFAEVAKRFEGIIRRLTLIGNEMEIEGLLLNGDPFDWSSYQGKVVLVDFWATWCKPCLAEMPNVKKAYGQYHDKGFDVVGISLDNDIADVQKYVESKEIPWAILFSPDKKATGWKHPMATYYGIHAIPAMMLVGQDGKVITLSARGPQLGKQLQSLLGDPLPLGDEKEEGAENPVRRLRRE